MKIFTIRIDGLVLRSCSKQLSPHGEHETAEIMHVTETSGYTVAYWNRDEDDFNMQFVGNRFLMEDENNFMELAQLGQELLDKEIEREKEHFDY